MKIKLPLLFTTILFLLSLQLQAQQVPSRIQFADMDLRLTSAAVRDIQAHVDALTRNEKYFQAKLERVDMYMPIIERIFREENLPDDFKYLVIQESALISDAVSSSNAVGFWQFKEISGLENDLRIDKQVDERMNIVSSSRAAATYLKDHNSYFDNWAYSLIAYQRGRGGAADVVEESNFGKTRLKISSDSYWYLKKFLAHKIAFQDVLGTSKPPYYLKERVDVQGKSLKTIAKEESVSLELLEEFNSWSRRGKIPEDKNYTVIVPLSNLERIKKLKHKGDEPVHQLPGEIDDNRQKSFPLVNHYPSKSDRSIPHKVEINGLDGIYAPEGYTLTKLASIAGVEASKFRDFNDLKANDTLRAGEIYYLQQKRSRAKFYYHTVAQHETMWDISQKYGLKLNKLYRKNRMLPPQQAEEGRVLWLRHNRPSSIDIEYRKVLESSSISASGQETKTDSLMLKPTPYIPDSTGTKVDSLRISEAIDTVKSSTIQPDSVIAVREVNTVDLPTQNVPHADSIAVTNHDAKNEAINHVSEQREGNDLEEETDRFDPDDFIEYSIRKGDTFFAISNRFNMKISTLLQVNDLHIRDTLLIGQVIKVNKNGHTALLTEKEKPTVPPKEKAKTKQNPLVGSTIKHKVASGDTMYSLARKYGVSLKDIMEWNNKEDYKLTLGELILIKQK